ncbi:MULTISPECIES: DUF4870 domain-containing protein [unclassified Janthinobacterium]|uniref:DUF4870 domain-containing protein n=1 Tax=unclassified Janthinobacterium TaxID=2610881 RepID=UPI000881278F|nr:MULTISPECIES: DUF4870 domain-containing protein [unclassified Janthinobacterium]SDA77146.1 hypothetical protein SAMN03159349_04315 [Janthinobacterium sp. 551a]SFB60269.1 hypothetical protein SAMN03159300_10945 [Janthinobacterium sp. 344]
MENSQPEVGRTQDTTIAILSHIGGLFTSWVAPLIIYLIKKDDADKFSAENAREALNFQITLILWYIACFILSFVLIGLFMFWLVALGNLVFSIIAAVKASNGVVYRYPLTWRPVK